MVLNENPLSLPREKLRDLRITAVYLGGRLCNPAQRPSFTGFLGAMIGGYLGGKYRG